MILLKSPLMSIWTSENLGLSFSLSVSLVLSEVPLLVPLVLLLASICRRHTQQFLTGKTKSRQRAVRLFLNI